jgi:hypothetical protein
LEQSESFQNLKALLAEQKRALDSEKDKSKQQRARSELRKLEKEVEQMLDSATDSAHEHALPEWLTSGIKLWVSVFNPGQIHLRVYPFESVPGFQVIANLKRTAFTDEDLSNTVFAYGNRPNVKLTVFGLVTSLPPKEGMSFDPMQEFIGTSPEDEAGSLGLEKGFRSAFNGMEEFASLTRYQRWPNVVVYPIAVYRQLQSAQS